jgi:hypothetical protein
MNKLVVRTVFGFAFALIAGCSSGADQPSNEDETSAADEQQLLAGDTQDLSGIAFDDPNDKAFDEGAARVRVTGTFGNDSAIHKTAALTADDAQDDANVDAPAMDTTPEDAAQATPESTIGEAAHNRPRMTDHGGPVMEHQNVYFIYYGNWAGATRTRSLIHNFVNALHYNNFNHSYWDGLEYADRAGHHAASKGVTLKGAASVGYPYGKKPSQADMARVVHSVLDSGKFPPDSSAIYFVMTSGDVAVEGDSTYCGWHSWQRMEVRFLNNYDVTLNVKYGLIRSASRGSCSEFGSPAHHSATPNGDYVADSEVSVLSHEMVEAMTDPQLNAWFDSNGMEDSDKCNFNFQDVRKVNGAYANLYDRHYRRWWLVQSQYRHNDACGMGASR